MLNRKNSLSDKEIILVYQGRVFSIKNLCSHINLPLDVGQITGKGTVLYPYHNSEFFKTGDVNKMGFSQPEQKIKECKPLTTINVREDEEDIWV